MERSKGLIILLGILFSAVFVGYFLIRTSVDYPPPISIEAAKFEWIKYVPPSKTFKVELPSLPQTTSKTFVDPKTQEKRYYEMYVSEKRDGTVFMISIIDFADIKSNVSEDEMLTAVANDMMTTHPENELIKTTPGKFKGNPSLRFELKSDKVQIDTLTFVIGKRLFVLNRVGHSNASEKEEFDFFTNSFDLTSRS